ncbi:nucleotide exchange factor GrpE [Thioalkalivibrio sp. XN279]|uniref:nucleotide exchange factor GrpE n=1 Tax=Thioalkalivibrio sp. XN279 TaxID=2714953 RepID=UPI00140DA3D2|nr:nucleotide exchange factor GrpE [Thioalkalivibrio sp. XN279]NHA14581.1 nucleotide exchange factor GrpE [Thioalkalivibrio sp. XN279]
MSEHDKDLQAEEITAAAGGTGDQGGEAGAGAEHAARADQAEQAAAELREQVLRAAAELENTRRRAARDVENAHRYGVERFARELLAVVDSLEMGREAARNAGEGGAVAEGMDATLRLLLSVLEKFGVTPVEAEGQPFDPEAHEAIMTQPTAEAAPDTVVTVVQPGYRIHERLLRPARVIVARAPDA